MEDKPLEKLWNTDRALRKTFPTQMWKNNQTIVNIRMFGGSEFFNTRPYHNYENWAEGYEITTPIYPNIKVTAEDLDDAIRGFVLRVKEEIAKLPQIPPVPENYRR